MDEVLIRYKDVEIHQQELCVLNDVNLELHKGEFVYLIGKVGSGKTSLLKTFYGELVCHYPQQRRGGERRTWREGNFAGIRIHSRRRIDGGCQCRHALWRYQSDQRRMAEQPVERSAVNGRLYPPDHMAG